MKAKYLKLASGSVLLAMLLAGCTGAEEPAEDPAVEENEQSETEETPEEETTEEETEDQES